MTIKAKMMFILIGDDRTGKTTLQKMLIEKLTMRGWPDKLKTNLIFDITHPEIKRKYRTISFANRSYQERLADYESIENYFANFFRDADIAFVSSHLVLADVENMIAHGKGLFFNVYGVFWSNSTTNPANIAISQLNWDERFIIDNPVLTDEKQIENQLYAIAENFITLIANRTSIS